jgi:AIPR protein
MASMSSATAVREYRIPVTQKLVKSFEDPHIEGLHIHHAYIKVRDFPHGKLPDEVNPRSHEDLSGRITDLIQGTLKDSPKWFHILNRGLLVLAQKAWYDNRTQTLHVLITSDQEGGLADGATTDRVIRDVKNATSAADFEKLMEEEIPPSLKDAYVHVEVISGGIGDMLVPLTGARNTSKQVKEFALENLGGGFEWLKDVIEESQFRGRIRYRENDPQPVDVRTVLGLLTLFHPKWNELGKEPVIAYTSKGTILSYYQDPEWRPGYELLRPVVVDILELYEYVHLNFNAQYKKYNASSGSGSKLGARKEVRYNDKTPFKLPLTGDQTNHFIADGWLYPLLAAFRMLLEYPRTSRGTPKWLSLPKPFYDLHGWEFVGDVCEQSENLGRNPNATGKSRPLWNNLRTKMELHRMKLMAAQK